MLTPTTNSSGKKELGESVIFQPVLQAYATCHSWIITAHISLGHLECHWKAFNRQLARTQQLLCFLDLATISTNSTAINTAGGTHQHWGHIQLLQNNHNICNWFITDQSLFWRTITVTHSPQKELLPFLGDALRCLTGSATTKDITSIKTWINQLIVTQSSHQETLVHVILY